MADGAKSGTFLSRVHLDPTVSIGHLVTTVGLLIAGLWWAADMYSRVELNTKSIQNNTARVEASERRSISRIEAVEARSEQGRLENRDYLQRIEDKLDRLIESEIRQ